MPKQKPTAKDAATKSPKSTIAGIAGFVVVLATAVGAYFDGDPSTVPQWGMVIAAGATLAGFLFTRDHDVSSEEAGS